MPYVVTATLGHGSNKRRVTSQKYKTKAEAKAYAKRTKEDRPGSNPRVKRVD